MRIALALACAAVALSGCGANTLGSTIGNPACVTKLSGEVAFGSITPTGKAKWSATCKSGPATDGVKPADVANPPAVSNG